jgi:type I restriction enzyme, S subunit
MTQIELTSTTSLTGKWKPYLAYKDSGMEWLGEIPAHWEMKRLRFICQVNPSKTEISYLPIDMPISFLPMEQIGEDGSISLEGTRTIEQVRQGYTCFRNRDVIVAKITPCFENGKGALCNWLLNGIGFGTTELHVLRAKEETDPNFIFYLTRSEPFREIGIAMMYGSAGQKRVPEDFIRNFQVGFPPLSEQNSIATYLNRESTRIKALIAKKMQLIELLQEKRAALISHAVTKGLDPTVPMKDSGVEWLGEIPAHWEVKRLKFITTFVTSGSRGWAQYYSDEGAIFLRIGNLSRTSISLDLEDIQHVSPPEGTEGERTKVKQHDVLVSITANIGSVAVVSQDLGEAYVNQHVALTRPHLEVIDSKWFGYCLLSRVGQEQFYALLYGGTKDGLGLDDVKNLFLLVPSILEQRTIATYLDRETGKIDALIARIREGIEKLKEYSTALISAAVTGKFDVRDENAYAE